MYTCAHLSVCLCVYVPVFMFMYLFVRVNVLIWFGLVCLVLWHINLCRLFNA